jgi:hypothetical protein
MLCGIILVVVFGAIESFERNDLGHDGLRKNFGLIELLNVGLSDARLKRSGVVSIMRARLS